MSRLTCDIVKDLLQSYVNHTTGEETSKQIEEHLAECAKCRKAYESLLKSDALVDITETDGTGDKSSASRIWTRIVLALCTIGFACALCLLSLWLYRTVVPLEKVMHNEDIIIDSSIEDNTLTVYITPCDGADRITGCDISQEDDIYNIDVYTSNLSTRKLYSVSDVIDLTDLYEVKVNGIIVYQDGILISDTADKLVKSKNAYIGDLPSDVRLTEILDIEGEIGKFANQIRSSKRPYQWTLDFSDEPLSEEALSDFSRKAFIYGTTLLACVDNLEAVSFVARDEDYNFYTKAITVESASVNLSLDIKTACESAASIQRMMDKASGFTEEQAELAMSEPDENLVTLCFLSDSETPVKNISITAFSDDGMPVETEENIVEGKLFTKGNLTMVDVDKSLYRNINKGVYFKVTIEYDNRVAYAYNGYQFDVKFDTTFTVGSNLQPVEHFCFCTLMDAPDGGFILKSQYNGGITYEEQAK